jgi:hypothetical protein
MQSSPVKVGLIVGLVFGGIAVVAGLVVLVCCIKRKGKDCWCKCLKRESLGK